jgi:hypothetical protein
MMIAARSLDGGGGPAPGGSVSRMSGVPHRPAWGEMEASEGEWALGSERIEPAFAGAFLQERAIPPAQVFEVEAVHHRSASEIHG